MEAMPISNKPSDIALSRILGGSKRLPSPSVQDAQEEDTETEAKRLKNEEHRNKIDLQKQVFEWIKPIFINWLIFIAIFLTAYFATNSALLFYGMDVFVIDKEVLIALLVTTTANILGLPFVITRSIFGRDK
jgi:hypothetical protein